VLCVGQFGVGLWDCVCAVSGRVWCGFVGVRLCYFWDSLGRVWRSECLMCVGQFGVGLWECFLLCVGSLLWVCVSECVLCVQQFGAGLWE